MLSTLVNFQQQISNEKRWAELLQFSANLSGLGKGRRFAICIDGRGAFLQRIKYLGIVLNQFLYYTKSSALSGV